MPKPLTPAQISAAMAAIGSVGGKAGRGDSKRRGSNAHYKALAAKAVAARWGKRRKKK